MNGAAEWSGKRFVQRSVAQIYGTAMPETKHHGGDRSRIDMEKTTGISRSGALAAKIQEKFEELGV
jgi:hypothetical protein